jgi:hypothetical protein
VTQQRVYRSTTTGGPYTLVTTIANNTTSTFTNTGLSNGTTYFYVLRAFDGTQESANSVEASAAPVDNLAPASPTGVAAADVTGDDGGAVTLNWTPSAATDVTQQRVYRSTTTGGPYTLATAFANNTTTTYTNTGLTNGTTYYFVIRAFDGTQESADSAEASAVPVDNLAPAAPTGLSAADTASDDGGAVTLTWTPSGAPDVTQQRVYRSTISGGPYTLVTTISNDTATTFGDTGLANGTTYFYVVRAYDGTQESADSNQASAAPVDNTPPAAPTGVNALDVGADQGGALAVTWSPSTAPDVTQQRVYRSTISGGPYSLVTTFLNNTTAAHTDTGLANGVTYYYVVRAFDGTQESANSNQASAVPVDNVAPAAPTGLSAADVPADGGGAIALNWTVSSSADVTQQRVYRSTTSGGPYTLVTTVANNTTTTYTDTGLTNGTTYYYVLRAFDGTQESANSAQASAVPVASTQVRQIIKGTGTTGTGATTVIDFTSGTGGVALLDLSRAFHVITYRHTASSQHAATFKSSAITSATQLTIFGSTAVTNIAVPFEYTIIELTPTSPTVVQRRAVTINAGQGGPGTPVTDTLPVAVVPGQTMLLHQGHNHNAGETTIGNEELDRVRLVSGTSWEVEIGAAPNTGPQNNRVELVQWDTGFVANVQRGLATLGTTATTLTVTPPAAVDRTRTLLFVSFREGTGSATSEPPSQIGLFATLNASNQIAFARQATGPALEIAWELVQFQPGSASVQHVDMPVATGVTTTTATIGSVTPAQTVALGTVSTPFGHSGAQASSTTNGNINTAQFTVSLDNATTVRVTRGTGTGTARVGVQLWSLTP